MKTPYRITKKLEEIINPAEVDIKDVSKLKSGLSSKIWLKGGKLKPEVRTKMIEIAKKFYEYLGLEYPILDIYFTGSLANYNWTSHSDADIHILFDLNGEEEDELLSDYIFAKKDLWSDKHNIKLFGFPVELFAKNVEAEHGAKAIYSLVKDEWVKKPSKKNVNIDSKSIQIKAAELMNKIDDLDGIKNEQEKLLASEKLKDKIKNLSGFWRTACNILFIFSNNLFVNGSKYFLFFKIRRLAILTRQIKINETDFILRHESF